MDLMHGPNCGKAIEELINFVFLFLETEHKNLLCGSGGVGWGGNNADRLSF